MHNVSFRERIKYDGSRTGITVPIELGWGGEWVRFDANLEAGT